MINRKILFMTIFSLAAHVAVAAVIVYAPYDMSGNSLAGHQDKLIWGYVAEVGEKSAREGKVAPVINPVQPGHPELVSGSQIMQGQEIPKTMLKQVQHMVRDDRNNDSETVFSSENEIAAPALIVTENVLAEGQKGETGITFVQSDGSDTGDKNNGNQGSNSYDIHVTVEYIRKEIERHKYYPDIARLRGDEGTVYINFYIGQDGTPSSIYVARSSGSGILDDAGIKTVRMVGRISNLHKELRELDIVVPITYKLGE